jgi:hypothetical protein
LEIKPSLLSEMEQRVQILDSAERAARSAGRAIEVLATEGWGVRVTKVCISRFENVQALAYASSNQRI